MLNDGALKMGADGQSAPLKVARWADGCDARNAIRTEEETWCGVT